MFGRNKVAMVVAEFLGTFSLASAMLAMLGRTTFPFFMAVMAGAAFGLMTLVFRTSSGTYVNPAVTIGMWIRRRIELIPALICIIVQLLGGIAAWKLTEYMLNAPLQVIGGDKFMWRVFVAEAVGAFIFAFGLSAAIAQGYKGLRYAVTAGSSLTLGILIASFGGNGLLNPSVALAVKSWNVAYIVGPIAGVIVGMSLYDWFFVLTPSGGVAGLSTKVTTTRSSAKVTKKPQTAKLKKRR